MSEYAPGQDPFSMSGSTEELTKDDLHKGGGAGVSKPGMYHVHVQSVELKADEKTPNIRVIMEILNGTEESEIGKKIYHRIYFSKKTKDDPEKEQRAFRQLVTFLFEFGTLSADRAFGNKNLVLDRGDFERLEGCQAVVKVELEKAKPYMDEHGVEKEGKDSYKILWNNNVWNLNHEFVADVPKDMQMAAVAPAGGGMDTSLADDLNGV